MKRTKRISAFIMALIMVLLAVPASAFAVGDGEAIISSVTSTDKDISVTFNSGTKSIDLEVPYSKRATDYNLAEKLQYTYESSVLEYKDKAYTPSVVNVSKTSSSALEVSYTEKGVSGPAVTYSADYTISIHNAAAIPASYTTDIAIRTSMDVKSVALKAADFTGCYTKNDGEDLSYVMIKGAEAVASLSLSGNNTWKTTDGDGGKVELANLGKLVLTPKAPGNGSFTVTAFDKSSHEVGSVQLKVEVIPTTKLAVLKATVSAIETLPVNGVDIGIAAEFTSVAGVSLNTVKFTSLPGKGNLYYNYESDAKPGTKIAKDAVLSAASLAGITYVPTRTAKGTDSFNYTAADASGNEFTGSLSINVTEVSYKMQFKAAIKNNQTQAFSAFDWAGAYKTAQGTNFAKVSFKLPDPAYGVLYTNSKLDTPAVEGKDYSLAEAKTLVFKPAAGVHGSTKMYFTASDGTNAVNGYIDLTINASAITEITKTIDQDEVMPFSAAELNTKFASSTGVSSFNYITFTIPASNVGTLYYNYVSDSNKGTAVKSTTKVFRTGSTAPLLDDVVFIPYAGKTGVVSIAYTAVDGAGNTYTGSYKITLEASDYDLATISYSTNFGAPLQLKAEDINAKIKAVTKNGLKYVKFDSISSSVGTLYSGYKSASSQGSKLSSTTAYYYNDTPSIDGIYFVPAARYVGSFNLSYTACDAANNFKSGKIRITVKEHGTALSELKYSVDSGKPLTLNASDLTAKYKELTADTLSYVKFTLPSANYGTLYYKYVSDSNKGTAVKADDAYYVSGSKSLVRDVVLVPAKGYSGSFSITYTAYNGSGEDACTGKITVTVGKLQDFKDVPTTMYCYDSVKWAVAQGITTGKTTTTFCPDERCTRAQVVTFLWRAAGEPEPKSLSNPFKDVKSNMYYYKAVLWAVEQGITTGKTATSFKPDETCTRAQVVTFLYRAAGSPTVSATSSGFKDVGANSSYLKPVAWAVGKGITTGKTTTTFAPSEGCKRGQIVTFLYRYFK